jgi:hypothetical protein
MSTPTPGPFGALKCGCTVSKLGQYIDIDYCDVHKSAQELLAVCEEFVGCGHSAGAPEWHVRLFERARAVIAKAHGA